MPHYLFKVQSDGCEFDLKAASFLDQEAAEKFARRLCAFFHPRRWSPTVVVYDSNGEEVFRSAGPGVSIRAADASSPARLGPDPSVEGAPVGITSIG
jgi:hypothetical protein